MNKLSLKFNFLCDLIYYKICDFKCINLGILRRLWHTGYRINSNKSTLDLFIGLMVCPLDLFIYLPSQNNSKIDNPFGIRLKNRSNEDRAIKIHTYTHFGNGSARLTDGNTQSYLFKYNNPLHKNKTLTRDLPNSKDKGISGF